MKANTLLRLFALTVFIALFSACATPAYIPPAPPPTLVAQISPTSVPTATTAPANTSLPPTATINATTVATATISATVVATATATASPTATATASPTATATSAPTNTRTATNVPPTRKPTVAATRKPTAVPGSFTVTWKTGFEYNPRDATSSWCQMHNQYQNLTGEVMPFQDFPDKSKFVNLLLLKPEGIGGGYQPIVGVANGDGTINHWQLAGWYAKALGWSNGIQKFPPDGIPASAPSDDWTWYGVAQQGQFCRYVYVRWKGQVSAAEYAPDGKLTNTNATLPSGAP